MQGTLPYLHRLYCTERTVHLNFHRTPGRSILLTPTSTFSWYLSVCFWSISLILCHCNLPNVSIDIIGHSCYILGNLRLQNFTLILFEVFVRPISSSLFWLLILLFWAQVGSSVSLFLFAETIEHSSSGAQLVLESGRSNCGGRGRNLAAGEIFF